MLTNYLCFKLFIKLVNFFIKFHLINIGASSSIEILTSIGPVFTDLF